MLKDCRNQVSLVVGGASGIGRVAAQRWADAGGVAAVADVDQVAVVLQILDGVCKAVPAVPAPPFFLQLRLRQKRNAGRAGFFRESGQLVLRSLGQHHLCTAGADAVALDEDRPERPECFQDFVEHRRAVREPRFLSEFFFVQSPLERIPRLVSASEVFDQFREFVQSSAMK